MKKRSSIVDVTAPNYGKLDDGFGEAMQSEVDQEEEATRSGYEQPE